MRGVDSEDQHQVAVALRYGTGALRVCNDESE